MNIGLDIGYSAVKAISDEKQITFPSAVGTPDKSRFSLGANHAIILTAPDHVQVGQAAVAQSRFLNRREDRHWITSPEWHQLFLAAVTELTTSKYAEVRIVTGLPVAFYTDRAQVTARLVGDHQVTREDRHAQLVRVSAANVIPQPFGALLSLCLDDRGRIVNEQLATGSVGIIDVGGKTTNLLSVRRLSEIAAETDSINTGAWEIVRSVRAWLSDHCPGLEDLRDHQIVDAITARQVKFFGDVVDLGPVVDATIAPMADQVAATAGQLWNGGATLDAILVSGGGALLLGDHIKKHFRHAQVVADPVFANARGFHRFATRLASR